MCTRWGRFASARPLAARLISRAQRLYWHNGETPMKLDDTAFLARWKPLALVALTLIVFGQVMFFGFVNWDDPTFLIGNPYLQVFTWENLVAVLTPGRIAEEGLYLPVTYLSHLLETGLAGFDAGTIHAVNLLLHLLNVLLVYRLIVRWTTSDWVALLAAACFAVHPLQVETVAWCMGRKDLLATAFALATLLAWQNYLEHRRWGWYAWALAAFALGMLAKPTLLTLPLVLLLVAPALRGALTRSELLAVVPFFLVSGGLVWVNRQLAQPAAEAGPALLLVQATYLPGMLNGWLARLALLAPPRVHYLLSELSAARLSAWQVLPWVALAAGVVAAVWRRWTPLWFGAVFATVTFAPSLSVLLLRNREFVTADRYGYLPLLGLALVLGALLAELPARVRPWYAALLGLWLVIAAASSVRLVGAWQNSHTLWQRELAVNPLSPLAHNSLGNAFLEQRERQPGDPLHARSLEWQAQAAYQRAAELRPDYAQPHYNLGRLELGRGHPDRALTHFRNAILADPTFAAAHTQLGNLLHTRGDLPGALAAYSAALRHQPADRDARYNRGLLLQAQGDATGALADFTALLHYHPRDAQAHFKLAVLYHTTGDAANALQHYRAHLARQPGNALAWHNLGLLLEALGELPLAQEALQRAVALNPADADSRAALVRVNAALAAPTPPTSATPTIAP
jgi:tetratricopeptide (TPR) repeat protein